MPQIKPDYLRPVVSYMMVYLLRPVIWDSQRKVARKAKPGDLRTRILTPNEVLILAENREEFTGITPEEFSYALEWAQRNVQATAKIRMSLPSMVRGPDNTWVPE